MNPKIHIHVGLPKAASTSIQTIYHELRDSECAFVGKLPSNGNRFWDVQLTRLFREDILLLPQTEFDAKYTEACMTSRFDFEAIKSVVISDELLSTVGFHTFYRRCVAFPEVARRCDRIFAGCCVRYYFVKRPFDAFLESYHRHLTISHGYPFSKATLLWYLRRRKKWFESVVTGEVIREALEDRVEFLDFDQITSEGMSLFHTDQFVKLPKTNTSQDRVSRAKVRPLFRMFLWLQHAFLLGSAFVGRSR